MMTVLPALAFPAIDPIAIEVGPLAVRWYSLAYIAGLIIGWRLLLRFNTGDAGVMLRERVDDFLVWATFGVILGGRLGYVLFYNPVYFFQHPAEIFQVWHGGMSFHGGFLGVVIATVLFCKKHDVKPLALGDQLATVAPIGLFFGRLANFINGELFGRVTDAPLGMVFPNGGPLPRHPSQLYEAALEGLVLFIIMMALRYGYARRAASGFLVGVFLAGYGLARFTVEFFREPDAQLGFLIGGGTMGQLLSLPMILLGLLVMYRFRAGKPQQGEAP